MAQGAGLVNVICADEKWFYAANGTRTEGDGATATDVTPKEAANLAAAGSLAAATDVKILSSDLNSFIQSMDNSVRP
jgi:hypothetical protein